ncbi:hypothetical protein HDU76_002053 [Blyttiomyces sp. JEL0837]|nr:hypothetical protein HDU76_002053 [Blyttiomyces sp. JEL0837]
MKNHADEQARDGYKCPHENCTASYKNTQKLFEHLFTHSEGKPYPCFACPDRNFKRIAELQVHLRDHHSIRLSRHMPRTENASYIYGLACENCNSQVESFDSFHRGHANGQCLKSNNIESVMHQLQTSTSISRNKMSAASQYFSQSTLNGNVNNRFQLPPQMHNKQENHTERNKHALSPPDRFDDTKVHDLMPNSATGCAQPNRPHYFLSPLLSFDDIQRQILNDVCMQDVPQDGHRNPTVLNTSAYARTVPSTSADTSGPTSVCSSSPSSASFDRIIDDIMRESLDNTETAGRPSGPVNGNSSTTMDCVSNNQGFILNKLNNSFSNISACKCSNGPNLSMGRYVESLDSFLWQNRSSKISTSPAVSSFVNSPNESSYTDVESFGGDSICTLHMDTSDSDRILYVESGDIEMQYRDLVISTSPSYLNVKNSSQSAQLLMAASTPASFASRASDLQSQPPAEQNQAFPLRSEDNKPPTNVDSASGATANNQGRELSELKQFLRSLLSLRGTQSMDGTYDKQSNLSSPLSFLFSASTLMHFEGKSKVKVAGIKKFQQRKSNLTTSVRVPITISSIRSQTHMRLSLSLFDALIDCEWEGVDDLKEHIHRIWTEMTSE